MVDSVPSILTSRLAKLNPFGNAKGDDENLGEVIDSATIAGGGHSARPTTLTKRQLRISSALKSFLVRQSVLSEEDVGDLDSDQPTTALHEVLDQPHINVPYHVTDRSHPLPEYFISSSHNTYLLAHQLYGSSSATAYEAALSNGARCVEIDAWDNDEDHDEPKVTHGYTLASNIPFRSVCQTIREVVDKEAAKATPQAHPAPIFISLENHCGARGQLRLAQIMRETWEDRLLSRHVRDTGSAQQVGTGEHVTLEELGAKIVVIVEHHFGDAVEDDSSSDEGEDEATRADHQAYREKKKDNAAQAGIIAPELAELGVYAQSVKPVDRSWLEGNLTSMPHHHLINVSESGLSAIMPASTPEIGVHNSQHLMRVYPKGTRISSRNLNPALYWQTGAQICALNWQTFDASMQLNEALFSGTDGYVLKPAALRAGGNGQLSTGRQKKLELHIAGATDVPVPEGYDGEEMRPYVTCTLIHPDDLEGKPPKRKTSAYKQHKGIIHKNSTSPVTDPVWDEALEWHYEENELVFVRIILKSDDKYVRNPMFAVSAVRLSYVVKAWTFIRMLDLKGRETHCTLLVKFSLTDV